MLATRLLSDTMARETVFTLLASVLTKTHVFLAPRTCVEDAPAKKIFGGPKCDPLTKNLDFSRREKGKESGRPRRNQHAFLLLSNIIIAQKQNVSITHDPGRIINVHGEVTSILVVAIKTAETSFSFSLVALYQSLIRKPDNLLLYCDT